MITRHHGRMLAFARLVGGISLLCCTTVSAQVTALPPYPYATNQTLRQMDSVLTGIKNAEQGGERYDRVRTDMREQLWRLIASDSLRTLQDFLVGSKIAGDDFFENQRVQYELALTALVLDAKRALPYVMQAWDLLGISIGRGQRIGSFFFEGQPIKMSDTPMPITLRAALASPETARSRAKAATNNTQVQALYDADQRDRQPPFDLMRLKAMQTNDIARRAIVKQIIAEDQLKTARDFSNAALIMQHGAGYIDYALAHELAIAGVVFGDSSSVWLLAATYDRMLADLGHRQRFGTQGAAGAPRLAPYDSSAINTRIRLTFGSIGPMQFLVPRRS